MSAKERLPNVSRVCIDRNKIVGYLLSEKHPTGKFKAKFFIGLGFSPSEPEQLEAQLRAIAQNEPVTEIVHSPFGTKYIVDGRIRAPSGKEAFIRTVWIIEHGSNTLRFVTAYPIRFEAER